MFSRSGNLWVGRAAKGAVDVVVGRCTTCAREASSTYDDPGVESKVVCWRF